MQNQQVPQMRPAAGHWSNDGYWIDPNGNKGYSYKKLAQYKHGNGYFWNGHFYPAFTFTGNNQNMMMMQQQQQPQMPDANGNDLSDRMLAQQQFSMQNAMATPQMQNVACPPGRSKYVQHYSGSGDYSDGDDYSDEETDNVDADDEDADDDYSDDEGVAMVPAQQTPGMATATALPQMQNANHMAIGGTHVVSHVTPSSVTTSTTIGGAIAGDLKHDMSHLRSFQFSVLAKIPPASVLENAEQVESLIRSGKMTEDGQIVASLGNHGIEFLEGTHAAELQKAENDARRSDGGGSSVPIFPSTVAVNSYHNSHIMPVVVEFGGITKFAKLSANENRYPNPNIIKVLPAKAAKIYTQGDVLLDRSVSTGIVNFIRKYKNIRLGDLRKLATYDEGVGTYRVNKIRIENDKKIPITQAELVRELYETYGDNRGMISTEVSYEFKKDLFDSLLESFQKELANTETSKDLTQLVVLVGPKHHGKIEDNDPNYYARLWYSPDASVRSNPNEDLGYTVTLTATLHYVSSSTQ